MISDHEISWERGSCDLPTTLLNAVHGHTEPRPITIHMRCFPDKGPEAHTAAAAPLLSSMPGSQDCNSTGRSRNPWAVHGKDSRTHATN